MPLLVGIHAEHGLEGIVLGADRQLSIVDEEDNIISKKQATKIYFNGSWALACYGTEYRETLAFCRALVKAPPEESLKKIMEAIEKGRYIDINELNARMTQREGISEEDTSTFLLAVKKPKLALYHINQFGVLKGIPQNNDFNYICLGSGEKDAQEYIEKLIRSEEIDRNRISIPDARKIVRGTIETASSKEPTVGMGFDMLIITKDKIEDIGRKIRRAETSAGRAEETRIDGEYAKNQDENSN